jgi:hypothetical protein
MVNHPRWLQSRKGMYQRQKHLFLCTVYFLYAVTFLRWISLSRYCTVNSTGQKVFGSLVAKYFCCRKMYFLVPVALASAWRTGLISSYCQNVCLKHPQVRYKIMGWEKKLKTDTVFASVMLIWTSLCIFNSSLCHMWPAEIPRTLKPTPQWHEQNWSPAKILVTTG